MVTTEPVGHEAWMPLNNHPRVKPTYDFYDTVTKGRTAIANGRLIGSADNAPDANFPAGSTTWHWKSPEPIANYLVENSVGNFDLERAHGERRRPLLRGAGPASRPPRARRSTRSIDGPAGGHHRTSRSRSTGRSRSATNGIVVGIPRRGFEEEMQTKITFAGGTIGDTAGTFNHENMHQWWGDNVSEAGFELTFFKEGYADARRVLLRRARTAATAAGGLGTPAGDAAFEASLASRFNT